MLGFLFSVLAAVRVFFRSRADTLCSQNFVVF
jgi:hypothetical protein